MLLKKGIEKFEKLFSEQMERLDQKGCPTEIIRIFEEKNGKLRKLVEQNECLSRNGLIPFIPVIPERTLEFLKIVGMTDENTTCLIREKEIENITPAGLERFKENPYFMIGVEPGEKTRGLSTEMAKKRIISERMFGNNIHEILAIITHSDVLHHRLLQCTETVKKGDHNFIPNIAKINGDPLIHWALARGKDLDWGTTSCKARV